MKKTEILWSELNKAKYEIPKYWVSPPSEVWMNAKEYRSSFVVYYRSKYAEEAIAKVYAVMKEYGWEVLRLSKPKISNVTDYMVRVYVRKKR